MTTSSSDRCTRISPSAVLDDRLDGKDLEWARDHLRRCEACRERVEEFREMLLRVGRLPKATVGSAAMDEAYTLAVPERLREEAGIRSFEIAPAESSRMVTPELEVPTPMRPEVTSIPDLMSELEREIFRDEPVQDHPTPLATVHEPAEPVSELEPQALREVPVDSHQEPEPPAAPPKEETDWARLLESIASASPQPASIAPAEALAVVTPEPPAAIVPPPPPAATAPSEEPEPEIDEPPHRNVVFDAEPALSFEEEPVAPAAPTRKSDTGMRLLVGFGAAACVLLAAVLYEGGSFLKLHPTPTASLATARASVKPSATPHPPPSASASAAPTAAGPPATVLYSLGNGAAGGSVFRIRPGTAVAGYTRLVFDMRGTGLPTMLITRTDDTHVQVIFKSTTVTGVPVNGISSYQVAAVEPGVQAGPDGTFTIDLARPGRVTAFTLAATGSYAWRLVVDVHTA